MRKEISGATEHLPVIVNYVMVKFRNGKDLALLIEKQRDDFLKGLRMKEPSIGENDYKNKAKELCYGREIDMYLNREEI